MENQAKLHTLTGASMDKVVPINYRRKAFRLTIVAIGIICLLLMAWQFMPKGLQVSASDVRKGLVERGTFRDEVSLRANALALNSVILDAIESGRVEEVLIQDGAMVKQGQLLFRLSNPQRNLDLLQRKGEQTQQVSNLANLQVGFQMAATEHQRRLSALAFELKQVQKKHERNIALAAQGYISKVALDESQDALTRQQFSVDEERQSKTAEDKVRSEALAQMGAGISALQSGLKLVSASVDALAVRAPIDGKLTDFKLQIGESITTGKRLGRIDDPRQFKLSAQVDEFYLSRIAIGHQANANIGNKTFALEVMNIFPQIKDGRFLVELKFKNEQAEKLNSGQSVDARITLGEPAAANLLPTGAYLNDTGGTWVFVLSKDGQVAERRAIKIGRRNQQQIEVLSGLEVGEQIITSSYAAFQTANRLQIHSR
jgi:HlyD family secretion protein